MRSSVLNVSNAFSDRAKNIVGSPIDSSISLLQQAKGDVISFAMGCPSADNLRSAEVRRFSQELLSDDGDLLNYGPTEGERQLRAELLKVLLTVYNEPTEADQLLITSGGMQGLDLVAKLFVNPGD